MACFHLFAICCYDQTISHFVYFTVRPESIWSARFVYLFDSIFSFVAFGTQPPATFKTILSFILTNLWFAACLHIVFDKRFSNENQACNIVFDLNKLEYTDEVACYPLHFSPSNRWHSILLAVTAVWKYTSNQTKPNRFDARAFLMFDCSVFWCMMMLLISIPRHVFTCHKNFISSFIITHHKHHFITCWADFGCFDNSLFIILALLCVLHERLIPRTLFCKKHQGDTGKKCAQPNERTKQSRIKCTVAMKNT